MSQISEFKHLPFEEYQGVARILHHLLFHYPQAELLNNLMANEVFVSWPTFANRDVNQQGRQNVQADLSAWAQLSASEAAEQLTELKVEYGRLFFGPGEPEAVPHGSVYLGEENLHNDRSTLALIDFYKAHQVSLDMPYNQPIDHIGLFLAVLDNALGQLLENPEDQAVKQFVQILLQQHLLPWAGRFCELTIERAHFGFYRGVAQLTQDFLEQLTQDFAVIPMPMRLFR